MRHVSNGSADGPTPTTEEFLRLLGTHERDLFAYVYALIPNWQDAEEIMQRLRIRIWQQFDQYEPNKSFDAWARAIAYYLVLAYREERGRQGHCLAEAALEAICCRYEQGAERADERRDILIKCLDGLEGRKQDLVREYYSQFSKRPSAEAIATKLSMTPNAVRQSLFRIRRMLLECVERTMQAETRSQ